VILPPTNTNPPLRLLSAFSAAYPKTSPDYIIQATGREMWIAATTQGSTAFTLHAPDLGHTTRFDWRSAKGKRTLLKRPLPSWARYPAGVIVHLCAAGMDLPGIDAVAVGMEPPGPRYNFSLGIAFATLWYEIHARDYSDDSIKTIVEQVRREYIEA
jgi:galactokinase